MRTWIRKVLPVLALSIVISEAAAAREPAMGASASSPPLPVMVANPLATGRQLDTGPGLRVAFQQGLSSAGELGSHSPASETESLPAAGAAKTSALVLSSLGMFGMISLLRLNRGL